jgi:4-hydroxy-2-oxoheptanedioate aldolase
MTGREIIQALHAGKFVYSSATTAVAPSWPDLVRKSGVDFVFVENEHTPLDRTNLAWICAAYAGMGLSTVVRIPCNDPYEACKALDAGASGIIGPSIESADQVRELVGAVKLRPLKGRRLQQALRDRNTLEPELCEYLEARNADKILIANIESVPAIENLHEICSVPGLDAVLIGPHDLSCSLGIPEKYFDPKFDEAVRKIFSIARQHHVGAGIHFWLGLEHEVRWAQAGGNLVMHSSDQAIYGRGLKDDIEHLRKALG